MNGMAKIESHNCCPVMFSAWKLHRVYILLLLLSILLCGECFRYNVPILPIRSCYGHRMTDAPTFNFQTLKENTIERMDKAVGTLVSNYQALRVNGVSPTLLDKITLPAGSLPGSSSPVPLCTVAGIRVISPTVFMLDLFFEDCRKAIELALTNSGLGMTVNHGDSGSLKVTIAPLSEERRKELVKKAKALSEESKVSLRNIRRDAVEIVKNRERLKQIDKDDSQFFQKELQKLTDDATKKIEEEAKKKERSLLTS